MSSGAATYFPKKKRKRKAPTGELRIKAKMTMPSPKPKQTVKRPGPHRGTHWHEKEAPLPAHYGPDAQWIKDGGWSGKR
jgi:hypothetical protein